MGVFIYHFQFIRGPNAAIICIWKLAANHFKHPAMKWSTHISNCIHLLTEHVTFSTVNIKYSLFTLRKPTLHWFSMEGEVFLERTSCRCCCHVTWYHLDTHHQVAAATFSTLPARTSLQITISLSLSFQVYTSQCSPCWMNAFHSQPLKSIHEHCISHSLQQKIFFFVKSRITNLLSEMNFDLPNL